MVSRIAAATISVNGPWRVRKASPLMIDRTSTLPLKPSPAAATVSAIQASSSAPLWAGLKRMFSRAFTSRGITLLAVLPTSMVVTSRFDGWKPS